MKIGLIGSGKVGSALGAWFAKVGIEVLFNAHNMAHAAEAARKAGHGAKSATLTALVRESQVILLTLPFTEIGKALDEVRHDLAGKTLVDVTNPVSPDHRSLIMGHTTSGAEEIARRFSSARVVKAFNAVFAEVYATQTPQIGSRTVSIFFAGDDASAKAEVRHLITQLGFDAVDAGPLINARYLEPLSLLNIHLGRVLGYGTHIGFSLLRNPGYSGAGQTQPVRSADPSEGGSGRG